MSSRLKVGVIGLGDIATKAYLPVLSSKEIEVHLCSRSKAKLLDVGARFRFQGQHDNLNSLIRQGIHAAFVHTTAATHADIVEELLANNIHVYVDKPLALNYSTVEKLVNFARTKKLILRVGFNRRYAPAYVEAKQLATANMIVMQKNRNALPGEVRNFIFEDFIHVIDTLLFLFERPITRVDVQGKKRNGLLYHVVVQLLSSEGDIAVGIMNRDCGTTEERLEIFTPTQKRVVYNLAETLEYQHKNAVHTAIDDWASTLYKRGFETIIGDFLQKVSRNMTSDVEYHDILQTHKICEQVVKNLEDITHPVNTLSD
jgi:virulence factor